MSPFGIFHTAVSILPIGFGLFAFVRDERIDPENRVGKLYLGTMLLGCVTAFGFIATKGFSPAQMLTVVTLALLFGGIFTVRGRRRGPGLMQTICLSATYFLLMFLTTTEGADQTSRRSPVRVGTDRPRTKSRPPCAFGRFHNRSGLSSDPAVCGGLSRRQRSACRCIVVEMRDIEREFLGPLVGAAIDPGQIDRGLENGDSETRRQNLT